MLNQLLLIFEAAPTDFTAHRHSAPVHLRLVLMQFLLPREGSVATVTLVALGRTALPAPAAGTTRRVPSLVNLERDAGREALVTHVTLETAVHALLGGFADVAWFGGLRTRRITVTAV